MKQLFWKEWMELRYLPLVCSGFVALFIAATSRLFTAHHEDFETFWMDGSLLLTITWALAGLIAGSGRLSVDKEGEPFLMLMPIKRRRLWGVKLAAGLGVLAASIMATFFSAFLMLTIMPPIHTQPPDLADFCDMWPYAALAVTLFAVAAAFSQLSERPGIIAFFALIVYFVTIRILPGTNSDFTIPSLHLDTIGHWAPFCNFYNSGPIDIILAVIAFCISFLAYSRRRVR